MAKWSAGQLGPLAHATPILSERHYELLDRAPDYELWLIHWPQDRGLVLHDHGGSAGAFYVTEGMLEETSTTLRAGRLRRCFVLRGDGKAFGPDYLHSVVNPAPAMATSVHAYSPPLTSMTFYSQTSAGLVVDRIETEWEGAP